MARFLFATQPIAGHVLPAIPLVQALIQRGHDVVWYAGRKFRSTVEETGARFAPYDRAYDYDDADYNAAFPGRGDLQGLAQIRFDFINVFIKQIKPQHDDLAALLRTFPADVTVGDPSIFATFALNEQGGPPNAVYNVSCLGIKGREVAPFGLGLWPAASPLGRVRNAALYHVAAHVVFRTVSAELVRQCRSLGLRPRPFDGVLVSPFLFLQPLVASFEYPRSDLPPQVHFIGALLPDGPTEVAPPEWWAEVISRRRPVVVVTQGTVATDPRELIAPTLQGLAHEEVVVVAAGVREGAAVVDPLPDNAHVAAFVPFGLLLPYADVYVTNGGFGGVQYALANGVPIVASGTTEDKPEIGNRIAYQGVGVNLKSSAPTAERVRAAVLTVLREPRYRERAQALQAALAGHNGPQEAAGLLERLAETRQPVFAPVAPCHADLSAARLA